VREEEEEVEEEVGARGRVRSASTRAAAARMNERTTNLHATSSSTSSLSRKRVEGDLVFGHAQFGEHLGAGLDHHGRAAQVELHRLGVRVILEILDQHQLVNEARVPAPVVFRLRARQRHMKREVRVARASSAGARGGPRAAHQYIKRA